jgi:UDP:flavonoid glycosyltransferase YjiC (YdhE family)
MIVIVAIDQIPAAMRLLFTTTGGAGHLHPLVPLAKTARASGLEVAFAGPASVRATVEALGFTAFVAGHDGPEDPELRAVFARLTVLGTAGRAPTPEARLLMGQVVASIRPRLSLPDLLEIGEAWRPDVVVRETYDFAGCLAAERLDLPHATVAVGLYRPAYWQQELFARYLDEIRRAWDLASDPDLAALDRYLYLSCAPPSFEDPAHPLPTTAHALRPVPFDRPGDEELPAWAGQLATGPTVYVTLGTARPSAAPGIFPELFQTIIAGVRDTAATVIVTVGRTQDPSALGPQPPHVRVERYIPQSLLLPRCDLVIAHGGYSTVLGALSEGIPLVLVPIAADQPDNAARCAALGVGQVIEAEERTASAIGRAAREVLGDPRYRERARRLREEIERLPGPEHGVALLARLATEKAPQTQPA